MFYMSLTYPPPSNRTKPSEDLYFVLKTNYITRKLYLIKYRTIESQNGLSWKNLKDCLVPTPLPFTIIIIKWFGLEETFKFI